MIDNFSLGLCHGLMLLAAWLLLFRTDLDHEPPPPHDEDPQPRFGQRHAPAETMKDAPRA